MTGLLVALAGACGALARFVVDGAVTSRRTTTFPWATFLINVTGSFVLGLVAGGFAGSGNAWRQVAGSGFCGGYTTFSTASMQTVRLVQRGRYGVAIAFGLGGLVASVAAAAAGWSLTR